MSATIEEITEKGLRDANDILYFGAERTAQRLRNVRAALRVIDKREWRYKSHRRLVTAKLEKALKKPRGTLDEFNTEETG